MVGLRDKLLDYFQRGYSEYCFFPRRQISGYTIDIEARKGDETVRLLYDPIKDRCREKNEKEEKEEMSEKVIEDFFNRVRID